MTAADDLEVSQPLAGRVIGVTADRRSAEILDALRRRGADVIHAPTMRIVPAETDRQLLDDTTAIINARPDVVLITTAAGIDAWLAAGRRLPDGTALETVLAQADIWARGPKARGAIRAGGLRDVGIAPDGSSETLIDEVVKAGVRGKTIAVQLHGYVAPEQLRRLERAGARVLTVAPYRWSLPPDPAAVHRLVDACCAGDVDAMLFTSAPAAAALLAVARAADRLDDLIAAAGAGMVLAAVGPVTAEPLVDAGFSPVQPERHRLGPLIRLVCEALESRGPRIADR